MSAARDNHRQAMISLDKAQVAKMANDRQEYALLMEQAFELEKAAAYEVLDPALEPTRSILLKGAALIALQIGKVCEAKKILELALSGAPPDYLLEEIREILSRIDLEHQIAAG